MGDQSAIEWTEATWNPLVGCSRVSEGCRHCYAERTAFRLEAMGQPQYRGLTTKGRGLEVRWTGKVNLVESALELPLKWKKPRRIFVNSMSDLFHEKAEVGWIRRIFAVMAQAKHHTFQVLTKRPHLMLKFLSDIEFPMAIGERVREMTGDPAILGWPLQNVWLGVSVEDQATADQRIPLLLETPAAVRWVSYEPALGPVDFRPGWLACSSSGYHGSCAPALDWIVVGGESGPGARPFDLAWARQTIAQGRAAGVPVFCKQLGAVVTGSWNDDATQPHGLGIAETIIHDGIQRVRWSLKNRKGGDPQEWPEDLRVREYPA